MIIVSDTTPLHYLILLGKDQILPALFGTIIIPEAVVIEMQHTNTPAEVRLWIDTPPEWASIKAASPLSVQITPLGRGETAAIAIALEENADAVLLDDRKAIKEARKIGINVLTTFAVLELAAINKLIDLEDTLYELSQTSFRMPPDDIVEEYVRREKLRAKT